MAEERTKTLACAALIALAVFASWGNSFTASFHFDDLPSILENPGIRDLSNLTALLNPPIDSSQYGRPLPNVTFAINYALGGGEPWGYHAVNLALHLFAALALFGLTRLTLRSPRLSGALGEHATPLALAVALLWAVHPLQTAAVTYVVQRIEVLASLFYLLTLYLFAKSLAEGENGKLLRRLALASSLCAFASKEMTVSLPLMVLLYDRVFAAGTFREAWAGRKRFYLALALCWLFQAWLIYRAGDRGETAGGQIGYTAWSYLQIEFVAVVKYLQLAFWPSPLVFDYGRPHIAGLASVLLPAAIILLLIIATLYALVKKPAAGFCAALFFAVLAPTSSVFPVRDPIFEHRMYLPLAGVVALVVCGSAYAWLNRKGGEGATPLPVYLAALLLVPALSVATFARNRDYATELTLWTDTFQKRPQSARAATQLGNVCHDYGKYAEAEKWYEYSLGLDMSDGNTIIGLGLTKMMLGKYPEALKYLEAGMRIYPDEGPLKYQYGHALILAGQAAKGADQFIEAARYPVTRTPAAKAMAYELWRAGHPGEALRFCRAVMEFAAALDDRERVEAFSTLIREIEEAEK